MKFCIVQGKRNHRDTERAIKHSYSRALCLCVSVVLFHTECQQHVAACCGATDGIAGTYINHTADHDCARCADCTAVRLYFIDGFEWLRRVEFPKQLTVCRRNRVQLAVRCAFKHHTKYHSQRYAKRHTTATDC